MRGPEKGLARRAGACRCQHTRGAGPDGVTVNLITSRIYVASNGSNNVSVIDGGTNTVVATVPVGSHARLSTRAERESTLALDRTVGRKALANHWGKFGAHQLGLGSPAQTAEGKPVSEGRSVEAYLNQFHWRSARSRCHHFEAKLLTLEAPIHRGCLAAKKVGQRPSWAPAAALDAHAA